MIKQLNKKYKIIFTLKNIVADIFCKLFLLSFPNKWSVLISERLGQLLHRTFVSNQPINLLANTDLLRYRALTFHEKEVETNRWIQNMPSEGIFYDVGANVGVFTILASQYCKKVYAFEPISLNYSVLNQNLMINNLDSKATAYCLAISDQTMFDTMRMSSNVIGSAHHSFGVDLDAAHQSFKPVFHQGSLAVSLDDLVYKYNFACPTYLKIDVDGNEHLVIAGAKDLLKDARLKSVLIELNKDLKTDLGLIEHIKKCGFNLTEEGSEAIYSGMRIGNLIFFRG